MWEVEDSSPGQTNTQGLKIIRRNCFLCHDNRLDVLVFSDRAIRTINRRSRILRLLCHGLVGDLKEPTSLFEKRGFCR